MEGSQLKTYIGIFRSDDIRLRSKFKGEEADTVTAYSHKGATHKLLYKDLWMLTDMGWELHHTEIPRKYKLSEVVEVR